MDIIETLIALGVIYGLFNKFFNNSKKRKYKQPNRSPAETEPDISVFNADEEMHKTTDAKSKIPAESEEEDHWTSKSADAGTFSYESIENDPDSYLENKGSLENDKNNEYQKSLENRSSLENRKGDIVRDTSDSEITRLKERKKQGKKSRIQKLLNNKKALADGIILSEVLGKPAAHRKGKRL